MECRSDGVLINVLVQLSANWCNLVQRNADWRWSDAVMKTQTVGVFDRITPMIHYANTPFHISLAVAYAARSSK
jgi:hypothetical protein